jgi:hypothetical protein
MHLPTYHRGVVANVEAEVGAGVAGPCGGGLDPAAAVERLAGTVHLARIGSSIYSTDRAATDVGAREVDPGPCRVTEHGWAHV